MARKTFESWILKLKQKMLLLQKNPNTNNIQLTVQQVDMNNVSHSLF